MSRTIKIDAAKWKSESDALRKRLKEHTKSAKNSISTELQETAAFIAEKLGTTSFPSNSAIGMAIAAMRFDVNQVYCTAGKVYEILERSAGKQVAGAFYGQWKNGHVTNAKHILKNSGSPISNLIIGESLRPALRESVRNKNGRVATKYPLQLVEKSELEAHMRVAIQEIGKTASGWFACAEKLGGDGNAIPWKGTARHGSDGGEVLTSSSESGVFLELVNKSPIEKKHISPGQVASILEEGKQFFLRRLQANKNG